MARIDIVPAEMRTTVFLPFAGIEQHESDCAPRCSIILAAGSISQHPAANSNMTCGDGDKLEKIKCNGRLHMFIARLYGVNGVGGTCQATTKI